MSHDPTSKELLGLQDDLQRLLDKRLMKQIRTEPVRASGGPDAPAPAPPARARAAVDYVASDDSAAGHNPAGPRSFIGRKRSSAPERTGRLHDRIRELEREILRLGLRAETAEEALDEAGRFYGEQVQELRNQVVALQKEIGQLNSVAQPQAKRRLSKILGR